MYHINVSGNPLCKRSIAFVVVYKLIIINKLADQKIHPAYTINHITLTGRRNILVSLVWVPDLIFCTLSNAFSRSVLISILISVILLCSLYVSHSNGNNQKLLKSYLFVDCFGPIFRYLGVWNERAKKNQRLTRRLLKSKENMEECNPRHHW